MFGKIKIKIATVALIAMVLTCFMQETVAYYSTVGKTTNVITSGNLQLIIHEATDRGEAFPEEGVYVMPGDVVSKKVTIENDCDHPFYLRVKILYGIDSRELPSEECFKLNLNTEHWELHDGWYYYTDVVEPGETTPHVFSQVEIVGSQVDNHYIGKTLTLTVSAQAVQSENNPLMDEKVYTASGWPAEEGGIE